MRHTKSLGGYKNYVGGMQPQMTRQEVKSTPPSQPGFENSPSFKREDKNNPWIMD
jgi:hypothetical protein